MEYADGGHVLVEVLRGAGVDTVFGIVSIHNQPLVEAVARQLRFVPVRHEATAVNAADGYARSRGGIGCALTSTGTGAGNAAGSLVEALAAGSRVLHVTGQIPTGYLDLGKGFIHETSDQLGMLTSVSKAAYRITDAVGAGALLSEAVAVASTPPSGPVSVEWPFDLQYAKQQAHLDRGLLQRTGAPIPLDDGSDTGLDAAADILGRARRPVIWAGGGATGAGADVVRLAERLRAGVFTSNAGRGTVPEDHPLCVGNFAATDAGQRLLDSADAMLSIGTHFRSNETRTYKMRVPAEHIQLDVDEASLGRAYPTTHPIAADARSALPELVARIGGSRTDDGWRTAVGEARAEARAHLREAIGSQAEICDAVRDVLPRDAIIARDVTIPSSSWGNRLLEIYDPRSNVFARGGGIGQGLGMGIGTALGRPDVPTLVIAGDGGLAVHLGDLLTLVQEAGRVAVMVFNDRGYGVLRNMQEAMGRGRSGVDLHTPDFRRLAEAVGLVYRCVDDVHETREVLQQGLADAPSLIEVDLAAIGEMPRPFTPPVDVPG